MQFITEDPIPFPPDPIRHSTHSTISEHTNNSNRMNDEDNNNNENNNTNHTQPQPQPQPPTTTIYNQSNTNTNTNVQSETNNCNNSNTNVQSQTNNPIGPITSPTKESNSKSSINKPLISLNNDIDLKSDSDIIPIQPTENTNSIHKPNEEGKEHRVKLYELSDTGNWNDEGTGIISFELINNNNNIQIIIMSEPIIPNETSQLLLKHIANGKILYDKQGDSIIQWLDDTVINGKCRQIERAISFQQKTKCNELWQLIGHIKGINYNENENENEYDMNSNCNNNITNNKLDFDSDDDDDVCMNESMKNNNKCEEDSNGLLTTFLNDCINENENDSDNQDDDIDMNNNKKKLKKKKKKKKKRNKKKKKGSYFDRDESNSIIINEKKSDDDMDDSDQEIISDDENDNEFLQKLTMRTQKKAKKNKLEIPRPTEHNLCEVYSKVKNAIENKHIAALNKLGTKQFINELYNVFNIIEQKELKHTNNNNTTNNNNSITPPPLITMNTNDTVNTIESDTHMSVDNDTDTQPQVAITTTSTVKEEPNDHNDSDIKEEKESLMPKLEKLARRPTLTPRLSTASLTTLPPSIDEEENERYHPLEFIFMIVLECCRESHNIKDKNKKENNNSNNKNKSTLKAKFNAINGQQLGYIMHTSLAQLLNGSFGHSPQRNTKQLMMVYLGKDCINKCIAMLEYDPIRRIGNNNRNNILLSYRHRNFLKQAQVEKLDIPLMDGNELYDEIEYVYKLNYVRDCILLGKLDLEQQSFHVINHYISRYNALICETIAEDTSFLIQLFNKIKESCSKRYGIIPLNKLKCDNSGNSTEKTSILTPTNDEPIQRSVSRTVSIEEDDNVKSSSAPAPMVRSLTNGHNNEDLNVNMVGIETDTPQEIEPVKMEVELEHEMKEDTNFKECLNRRQDNRRELFTAPDGTLFRFLSEFLARVKMINEPNSRSGIFSELIANGLLETLSVCVSAYHVLPTKEFSHIWLVLVECIHHMISTAPCGCTPQVRTFIVKQIEIFNESSNDIDNRSPTLLQRLCSAFSPSYICDNDGILEQIYFVLTGILGLGDLMGLDNGAQSLSYVGLGADRDAKKKDLNIISKHFFDECVPLFYNILSRSQRYMAYHSNYNSNNSNNTNCNIDDEIVPSYSQVKRMQKIVINLLAACCDQEQFIPKLKDVEEKCKLMSSIHDLIYVPRDCNKNVRGIINKDLSMCCIQFLRSCIHLSQHDSFWSDGVKNYGLFKNILGLFDANGLDTYNMINSTVLSIFASIEDKKLEDIIKYLGDEKILDKYSKLISYTCKFDDLLELYEKAKHGIPLQRQLDEGSTTTLSNCDSLSPRISPSGLSPGLLNVSGAWRNEPSKEEIHYFDHDDSDNENDNYLLDDGHEAHEQKEREEDDINKTNEKCEQDEDIDMNNNNCDTPTQIKPPSRQKNGLPVGVYKDSPRPQPWGGQRKELKLPNRQRQEDGYDLLGNKSKIGNKSKKINVLFGVNNSNGKDKECDKDNSPFLDTVSNAMDESHKNVNKKKRKFDEMSGGDDMDLEPTVTTTSNFFDKKFDAVSDNICDNNTNASPLKKKLKLGNGAIMSNIANGGHIIDEINESPDTFDTNEVSNNEYNKYKNINGDCHNNNINNSNNNNTMNGINGINGSCQSILLNGDSIHKHNNTKDKHVHFNTNNTNENNNNINNLNNLTDIHMTDNNMTDNLSNNNTVCQTAT